MCGFCSIKVLLAGVNISTLELARRTQCSEQWKQTRHQELLAEEAIEKIRPVHKNNCALKCLRRVRLRKNWTPIIYVICHPCVCRPKVDSPTWPLPGDYSYRSFQKL